MQVTHVQDHITHALIGGAKTIEFGISSDAAFFNILSSTIYSDQRLAVAREVLCNSWDAHIRANKTDTTILVTINESQIIVRDFGAGIHPEMMGPLYGTYGGTDKKNNGTETGGFGLGCKSPFAYNDHFEVISWHEGTKTIYNLSKSSADKMGKPGITPIVALPCGDETGLQVTIPLVRSGDASIFESLFKQVAFNGGMNVTINGKENKKLPLSEAESNWLITKAQMLTTQQRVLVRYGNVVYPVELNPAYQAVYARLITFLDRLTNLYSRDKYRIVFQAKPDSISVTPSRESLSMQEHTIKTLTHLLNSFFVTDLSKKIADESVELLDKQIAKVTAERKIGELMNNVKVIPGIRERTRGSDLNYIGSISDLAIQFTLEHYPNDPSFYRRDMNQRLDAAIELKAGKRGHLNQVRKALFPRTKREKNWNYRTTARMSHEWFKKKILRPLYRDIQAEPVVDLNRLYIAKNYSYYRPNEGFVAPHMFHRESCGEYLPVLRNILVLTYSKKDLGDRRRTNPEIVQMGGSQCVWIYHAPVAKNRIQAIRDFFKARGFKLVDLTEEIIWEQHKVLKAAPDPNKVAKPKLSGFPALKGVEHPESKSKRVDNCFIEGQPRVMNPVFFTKVEYSRAEFRAFSLGQFSTDASLTILKMFGDVCAVVRTEPQAKKLKEMGLMELDEYVISYVTKRVTTAPEFNAYWTEDVVRAMSKSDGQILGNDYQTNQLALLFSVPEVRTLLGLKTTLNEQDQMILSLWRNMANRMLENTDFGPAGPSITATRLKIAALPVSPEIIDLAQKAKSSVFISVLEPETIKKLIRPRQLNPKGARDQLAKIVKVALLG